MRRFVGVVGACALAVGALAMASPRADAATTMVPKITVVAPGKAPLTPLRLVLAPGTVHGLIEFRQEIHQLLDGTPSTDVTTPPVRIPIDVSVDAVAAQGDASVTTGYGAATVVDDGSWGTDSRAALETALAGITALTTTATVTPRNVWRDPQVAGTDQLDDSVAPIIEQLGDQMGNLIVVFPQQAVGVGGRWRTMSSLTVSGIDVVQTYDYTVRTLDGSIVTVDVDYVQTAPRQRVTLPGVPKTARVDLTRYRVTGSGSITLDLTSVLPTDSTIHASGVQTFRIHASGDEGTLTQRIVSDVALTPGTDADDTPA
jgi:hypothetical protein